MSSACGADTSPAASATGRVIGTRLGGLKILRPEDGATFRIVSEAVRQRVVCRVAGNPDGRRLWWFADGSPVGETVGAAPFAADLEEGEHVVTCSTEDGATAAERIRIGH